jgi:hypothetical protein
MRLTSELFIAKPELVERTGGKIAVILPDYRECTPQGIGLESHDDIHTGLTLHSVDQRQVAAQFIFIYYIIRCSDLVCFHLILFLVWWLLGSDY